jgi:hypothetical protein
MGTDFIQRTGKTLKRSWDEGRVAIGTRDLTTREPVCVGRGVAANIVAGARVSAGDAVNVELEGDTLVFRRGLSVVARKTNPPAEIAEAVRQRCNIRPGTVDQVHDIAGMVEITVSC